MRKTIFPKWSRMNAISQKALDYLSYFLSKEKRPVRGNPRLFTKFIIHFFIILVHSFRLSYCHYLFNVQQILFIAFVRSHCHYSFNVCGSSFLFFLFLLAVFLLLLFFVFVFLLALFVAQRYDHSITSSRSCYKCWLDWSHNHRWQWRCWMCWTHHQDWRW